MLTVLAVAAFVAGLTGTWSPCGFSMVASLGPCGHSGGQRTTVAALATFVPGALAGGAITFGALAALGALLGGGGFALAAGAAVAGAAALAELAGVRIVPQIRRQVPEHWRRVLPLPLAAAGYGVLLGLGFTTFVLTFAVPALAGVALAVGDVGTGLVVGLAFGAGRALPVLVLAPFAERPLGWRATELMAERPAILRGFRAADAVALGAVALTLGAESASAQVALVARGATDPSAASGELAWHVPGGPGALRRGGETQRLTGAHPAVGGPYLATIEGDRILVSDRSTGLVLLTLPAVGADQLAVSERWLVVRRSVPHDELAAYPLPGGAPEQVLRVARGPEQLGRPSLDGDRLVYHVAGGRESRLGEIDLATGARRVRRRSTRRTFTNPSVLGDRLLYVETSPYSQSLILARLDGTGAQVLVRIAPAVRADKGYTTKHGPHRRTRQPRRPRPTGPPGSITTLWSTALTPSNAYVTRLRTLNGRTTADLLRRRR